MFNAKQNMVLCQRDLNLLESFLNTDTSLYTVHGKSDGNYVGTVIIPVMLFTRINANSRVAYLLVNENCSSACVITMLRYVITKTLPATARHHAIPVSKKNLVIQLMYLHNVMSSTGFRPGSLN
jgi:hypothetical protein